MFNIHFENNLTKCSKNVGQRFENMKNLRVYK